MAKKRYHDNDDIAQMIGRMIRSYGKRVSMADVEDLRALLELSNVLDDVIVDTVTALRTHEGFSWRWIAEATGTSRQAAQQRFGPRLRVVVADEACDA
jgi:hypothetical protein